MIRTIKNLIFLPLTIWIRFSSISKISNTHHKRLFVFDIDNTIADTVPSMLTGIKWNNEAERISTLAIFIKMYRLIKILEKSQNNIIIYMTARNYLSKKATEIWLREVGLNEKNKNNLIITRTAEEKYNILSKVNLSNKFLYYIDDLTYINEDGSLTKISKINRKWESFSLSNKNVKFYSLDHIKSFINSAKSRQ